METLLRVGASTALAFALRMHFVGCGGAVALAALVDRVVQGQFEKLSQPKAPEEALESEFNMVGKAGETPEFPGEMESGERASTEPWTEKQVEAMRMALTAAVLVASAAALSLFASMAFTVALGQVAITYNATRIITPLMPSDEKS